MLAWLKWGVKNRIECEYKVVSRTGYWSDYTTKQINYLVASSLLQQYNRTIFM